MDIAPCPEGSTRDIAPCPGGGIMDVAPCPDLGIEKAKVAKCVEVTKQPVRSHAHCGYNCERTTLVFPIQPGGRICG